MQIPGWTRGEPGDNFTFHEEPAANTSVTFLNHTVEIFDNIDNIDTFFKIFCNLFKMEGQKLVREYRVSGGCLKLPKALINMVSQVSPAQKPLSRI